MKHVEFYRNNIDGKVLVLTGGQAPESVVYDGQELTHLVAGSVDAAQEKHVPAFQKIEWTPGSPRRLRYPSHGRKALY